jgi:hypothetical protein
MLTAFAYARSPSAPLGDVFFSVSVGFFQRGISAMMTFLGLGFGVWIFVLSGSLFILLPCFKSRPLIDAGMSCGIYGIICIPFSARESDIIVP